MTAAADHLSADPGGLMLTRGEENAVHELIGTLLQIGTVPPKDATPQWYRDLIGLRDRTAERDRWRATIACSVERGCR